MMENFKPKARYSVAGVSASDGAELVKRCELEYSRRVSEAASEVQKSGSRIVMLSGPSASGKTTSAHRISREFVSRGHRAVVVSLDNFFKSVTDYPLTEDGKPDMEHVGALDLDCVRRCLEELVRDGRSVLPTFDFVHQRRSPVTEELELCEGDIAIIEGIHALNPLLSETIPADSVFKIYVGLRAEYYEGETRILPTRDLRITRRLVRDHLFRGYSVRNTLEMWQRIMQGEERWIKPFKVCADRLLDSSFAYEPRVFRPVLEELCEDEGRGGEYRGLLLRLLDEYRRFEPISLEAVPPGSILREFLGGLSL